MTSIPRMFWSTAEAAAFICVTEDTLWRWARENETLRQKKTIYRWGAGKRKKAKTPPPNFPFIRLGRSYRFPIEEFRAWATSLTASQKES